MCISLFVCSISVLQHGPINIHRKQPLLLGYHSDCPSLDQRVPLCRPDLSNFADAHTMPQKQEP